MSAAAQVVPEKNRTELDLDSKALLLVVIIVKNGLGLISPF